MNHDAPSGDTLGAAPLVPAQEQRNALFGDAAPRRSREVKALAASELRYRRLFETAKDGILILDADTGVVVDVNPFLENLLGYAHEQMVGKAVWELGFLKDAIASRDKFLELQRKEYVRYENLPMETIDGRRIEVEFVSNVYRANHEKVIQCNIRDISTRRRAERALRASEAITYGIINAIPARVFWKDANLRYLGCNTAFARDAGFADEKDVVGKDDFQMGWRNEAELYRAADRKVIDTGCALINFEELQTTPDGQTITLLTSKVPLRTSEGAINGVLGTYLDITAHKREREDRARLATAVEQSAETIVITDAAGTILYVNPAFEKSSGYSREEAIGRNPRLLKSGKHNPAFYQRMWSALSRGEVWRGRFTNKRKDGTLYEEDASISPVRDASGKIINFVASKRDVTHEAQLEVQLRQAQKMEAVGRLAGGVAHDFNNLLTGIMGYAELCRDIVGPEHPTREWLDEITSEAKRSAEIAGQLLAFARKQTIAPKVMCLDDAVVGMLKLLRRLIGEDIDLSWMPGPNPWLVRLDRSQVDQVLANLCINARDAISGTGSIHLKTENVTLDADYCAAHVEPVPGDYVLLTVSDSGCGMDPDTLAHLFEPFFSTKDPGKGTGLGLATVYGIVKQNDGCITVYSEVGHGTTFRIYLPRVADEVAVSALASPVDIPKGHGETILLVEDEKSLRVTCSAFLTTIGYKVLIADTPKEAWKMAQGRPDGIQLLLTDVVMPGLDGKQLAQRICALSPKIKVLFMSGYPADVIATRGILEADTPFVAKPFTRSELASKIRVVLKA